MKCKPLVDSLRPTYQCQKYMDKLMSDQQPLGQINNIKERKAKPIIANSQANIGDTAKKWKYFPIAINQKITDECCTPICQSQSLRKSPKPNHMLPTLTPKPKIKAMSTLLPILRQEMDLSLNYKCGIAHIQRRN